MINWKVIKLVFLNFKTFIKYYNFENSIFYNKILMFKYSILNNSKYFQIGSEKYILSIEKYLNKSLVNSAN